MIPVSHPLQFLLVALAGWINQQQREVIEYLQTENRAFESSSVRVVSDSPMTSAFG